MSDAPPAARSAAVPFRDPIVVGLIGGRLALHAVSTASFDYGLMGDETYLLACAQHLDIGYVDHPAFSVWVLWAVTAVLGEHLWAIRWVPALCGACVVFLTADLARILGGGRSAVRLAALAACLTPVWLTIGGYYSMNAFDGLFWAAALHTAARIATGQGERNSRIWVVLGGVLALGLLNKLSVLWLCVGLAVGLLATPLRTLLRTPGPWMAAGLAALGLAPYVVWQATHDWVTLSFIANGSSDKLLAVTPTKFFVSQLLIMGPHNAPVWIGGLAALLAAGWARRVRFAGVAWLVVCGLLVWHGHVRAYYLAAAYPPLYAAGAVAIARLGPRVAMGWAVLSGGVGLILAPLALPLMPTDTYLAYEAAIGLSAPVEQDSALESRLPLHFAAKLSGPPVAAAVVEALEHVPADLRDGVVVLCQTYTEAGAVDHFLGAALRDEGVPVLGLQNAYWTWGFGDATAEVVLVPANEGDALLGEFGSVEKVASVDCRDCLGHVKRSVYLCRDPKRPLAAIWEAHARIR